MSGPPKLGAAAPIPARDYLGLLESLSVGSPIAEDDSLLFEARVETSVFGDLISDRIDIVRGTKGSGKSALYRLMTHLDDPVFKEHSMVLVKGVESTGDPVFAAFTDQFGQLDDVGFQNFWRIYFFSLILSQFVADKARYGAALETASKELADFKRIAKAQGFPVIDQKWTLKTLVGWVLSKVPKVKLAGKMPDGFETSIEVETTHEKTEAKVPIFVSELHDSLIKVAAAAGIRIWVLLDRLDEVFPRRSAVETAALRALLRTTLAFRDPRLRIKIFLRDDIFDSITEGDSGFTALTHVLARSSDILQWSREQILQLIVNRVYASEPLCRYFGVDRTFLGTDPEYRAKAFYLVFPPTLRRGSNQSSALDWLYNHCADANGVVTPRDIIDLVNLAKGNQIDLHKAQPSEASTLLGASAVLYGHRRMSEDKKLNYLDAEFRHFQPYIEKFESRKAEHSEECVSHMLGNKWQQIVKDLRSIGFLARNATTGSYVVPFIYRSGLGIRQGKCAGTCR